MKRSIIFILLFTIVYVDSQNSNLFDIGNKFLYQSKADSAINYYLNYEKTIKNSNDTIKGILYIKMASAYRLKEQYAKTQKLLLQSQNIFIKANNKNRLAQTYISLAEHNRVTLDFIAASRYMNMAKLIIEKYPTSVYTKAYYWNRKAALHAEYKKDYAESIYFSKLSLKYSKIINDLFLQGISYNEIGFGYENTTIDKAENYYQKAVIKFREIGNDLYLANALLNISRLYAKKDEISNQHFKKFSEAKKYIDEGIKISIKMNSKNSEKEFYIIKSYYYEMSGDFRNALIYDKKAKQLEVVELKKKWDEKIMESERKFQFAKSEKELKIQKLTIDNQNNKLKNSKKTILIIIIFTCIILIVSIVATNLYINTKKSNKILNQLYSENEFLVSEANHRINNSLQLIIILITDKLKRMNNSENENIKVVLKKVESISTLHRHLYKSADKKKINLKEYLGEINSNFEDIFKENNISNQHLCNKVLINSDSAMYIGLLLTELYMNSIKHAFTDHDKEINFSLVKKDNTIFFSYQDNGHSLKENFTTPKLINQLCKQLKVDYSINIKHGFGFQFKKSV